MTRFCVQSFTIPFIFKELLFVLKKNINLNQFITTQSTYIARCSHILLETVV